MENQDCTENSSNCAVLLDSCTENSENCAGITESGRLPFRWSRSAEKAAALLGENQITNIAIAAECKVSPRTLSYWLTRAEFKARVEEHKRLTAKDAFAYSIARRVERVRALDERWAKMRSVIEGRAADMPDVPGGPSGLLVRKIKSIGAGPTAREVEEYEVDAALLKEMREHERQAAIEVGQWQEQAGQALKPGEARLTVTYDAIQQLQTAEPERWARIQQLAAAIERDGPPAGRQAIPVAEVVDAAPLAAPTPKRGRGRPRKVAP